MCVIVQIFSAINHYYYYIWCSLDLSLNNLFYISIFAFKNKMYKNTEINHCVILCKKLYCSILKKIKFSIIQLSKIKKSAKIRNAPTELLHALTNGTHMVKTAHRYLFYFQTFVIFCAANNKFWKKKHQLTAERSTTTGNTYA